MKLERLRLAGTWGVQEIAEDSADKWEYEARIAKRFGFEQQLELPIPSPEMKAAAN